MEKEVCIRNLDLKDEAEKNRVVDIVNQCYRGRDGWTNEAHLVVGPRLTVERLENDSQVFSFFVAEHRHSGIIGCIKTGIVKETFFGPLSEPSGFAGVLAVLPKFQGQGVGSQLLSFSEAFCRGKGVPQMVMGVLDCRQELIQWYRRCGYVVSDLSIDAESLMESIQNSLLRPSKFLFLSKSLVSTSS